MAELPEHVRRNRAHWDQLAPQYVAPGEHGWAINEPNWGIWSVPDSGVRMFPDNIAGADAIELGCGTAYVSSWLARRGARVVGIDNSEQQLVTARRLQREHGLNFPLIHGNAESVPYPDASFDFAVSEYGACLWADPYRWVPEGSRRDDDICARHARLGAQLAKRRSMEDAQVLGDSG
jgi:SAM-dependent methyltransferase